MSTVIGLTGPMGAGKSTVAAMLGELGAEVLDADAIVREERRAGTEGYREIVQLFGPGILAPDGEIDASKLAAIVFADPNALRRLEEIVHPRVRARVKAAHAASGVDDVLVVEAIKLLESPIRDLCDEVWVVMAPHEALLVRLAAKGIDERTARTRLEAQADDATFRAAADEVILNDGSLAATRDRVASLYRRVKARRASES